MTPEGLRAQLASLEARLSLAWPQRSLAGSAPPAHPPNRTGSRLSRRYESTCPPATAPTPYAWVSPTNERSRKDDPAPAPYARIRPCQLDYRLPCGYRPRNPLHPADRRERIHVSPLANTRRHSLVRPFATHTEPKRSSETCSTESCPESSNGAPPLQALSEASPLQNR